MNQSKYQLVENYNQCIGCLVKLKNGSINYAFTDINIEKVKSVSDLEYNKIYVCLGLYKADEHYFLRLVTPHGVVTTISKMEMLILFNCFEWIDL